MSGLAKRSVNVIMLGRMGFIPAFDIQSRYARQQLDEMAGKPNANGEDTLLLVEHSPVYTVGIRNKDYTQDDVTRLKATGAQFYTTNRGGLITFHGPGQLVAYPILNLTRFKPSMKWYVCQLEKTLMETLQSFGVTGRVTDQTGVWVGDRKIASIGLHGTRYVTTHGVSLNCNTNLSWFKAIEPCGLKGVDMTSISRELKADVSVKDAAKPFLRAFQEVFNCDLEYRMLDSKDMKTLDNNNADTNPQTSGSTKENTSPNFTNVAYSEPNMGVSSNRVGVMDQRGEIGIRQISTLASSSSKSSSSQFINPLPSSSSTSNLSWASSLSSPTASASSSSSTSFSSHYNLGDKKTEVIEPFSYIRRVAGPMW